MKNVVIIYKIKIKIKMKFKNIWTGIKKKIKNKKSIFKKKFIIY